MERSLCNDGGRHWSDAVASQRTQRTADHNQTLKRDKEGFFPKALECTELCQAP